MEPMKTELRDGTDPVDRPSAIFGGRDRLRFGAAMAACVLLPIIPGS